MFCFHSKSRLSSVTTSAGSVDCRTDGSGHSMSTASGSQDDLTTSWTTTVNDYNKQHAAVTDRVHLTHTTYWHSEQVLCPTWHKNRWFRRRSPRQSLGLEWRKQNRIQQKHTFTNQRSVLQHKINTKKLKPALVASYDIQPGNGDGLFRFRRFINLSLAYLRTYTLNYSPGPTRCVFRTELNSQRLLDVVSVNGITVNSYFSFS